MTRGVFKGYAVLLSMTMTKAEARFSMTGFPGLKCFLYAKCRSHLPAENSLFESLNINTYTPEIVTKIGHMK